MKNNSSIQAWWHQNIDLSSLGTSFFTAIFIASLEIIFVISFITLIFSGPLVSQIPRALGFIILGDAILCLVVALLSSTPVAIAIEQDAPGVMLSVVAAGIVSTLSGSVQAQFATVTMMIVLTSAATGIFLVLLGAFNLGGLVRFLPYPIIGGFLAGTGWLLVQGGIGTMVAVPLGLAWFQPGTLALWLPGAALALVINLATRKFNQPYTIPVIILIALLAFYGLVWGMGIPLAQLQRAGWLLDTSMPGGGFNFALNSSMLANVNWQVLLKQVPALIPVGMISVIALLLNSSGLELITKKDLNLNRELITTGIGNLAASLTGGLVGYTAISFSALNHSMSGGKRLVGIFTALLVISTIIFGATAILYIPKFIFGAVLIFLGLGLLVEWVYDAWFKFPRVDFLVVIIILSVIVLSGFLQGIMVGLVLAVIMFAISYSQISVVKFAVSGREFRSRVTRSYQEQQVLDINGDQLHILKLEGFIFFGTANGLLSRLRQQVKSSPQRRIKFILIDFSKVSGLDSTGMLSFARMIQWAGEQGIDLIFTGLIGKMRVRFNQEVIHSGDVQSFQFIDDLDHGLEWCENAILTETMGNAPAETNLTMQLSAILPGVNPGELIPYLQRREFSKGEYLIREGDAPDLMYFIESGQVTALLESLEQKKVRLETMRGGRTVGEMGLYLHNRRSASVVADELSVVYSLSEADLARMENEAPQSANIFHRLMVMLLSERVGHLTRTVTALERS